MDNLTVLIGYFTIIGTNIGLFLWSRSEARSDTRQVHDLINAIHLEMKDFHGRLCNLEARWHEKPTKKEESQ